jgi:23S rRNA pseudouridine1911/1915/1917 synthase
MEKNIQFVNKTNTSRLDIFVASKDIGITRSQVQKLAHDGFIYVNHTRAKAARKMRPGDIVSITIPPRPMPLLEPEDIPLSVLYNDNDILVIDKPAGIVVHPSAGHPSNTLVNAILFSCPELREVSSNLRPGIVHRLDKDTSGVMVIAKSNSVHNALTTQWKNHSVKKRYLALVPGNLHSQKDLINCPIGRHPINRKKMAVITNGRSSQTRYQVIEYRNDHSLIEVSPLTGRTHQIRVHLAYIGHPLTGDTLYGKKSQLLNRQFLHANYLGFHHPATNNWVDFSTPLPADLQLVLDQLAITSPEN